MEPQTEGRYGKPSDFLHPVFAQSLSYALESPENFPEYGKKDLEPFNPIKREIINGNWTSDEQVLFCFLL